MDYFPFISIKWKILLSMSIHWVLFIRIQFYNITGTKIRYFVSSHGREEHAIISLWFISSHLEWIATSLYCKLCFSCHSFTYRRTFFYHRYSCYKATHSAMFLSCSFLSNSALESNFWSSNNVNFPLSPLALFNPHIILDIANGNILTSLDHPTKQYHKSERMKVCV